jgi:hypothetical protein
LVLLEGRCEGCAHFYGELLDGWKMTCDAFPDGTGIPLDYVFQLDPATLPECANGIGFEPIKCVEASVVVASAGS